jgi:cell division protein FtsQ
MAREKGRSGGPWRLLLSLAGWTLLAICILVAVRRMEAYAATDPQFTLAPPRGGAQSGIAIEGLRYASRSKVMRVFDADFERSVFLTPLAERRRRLLAVDWVEDATVSRLWPNRIWVRVQERRPVAFVNVPLHQGRPAGSKIALIDAHGVILEQPAHAKFAFPVLTGVSGEQTERERRRRVVAMLALLRDLGPAAAQISEVDTEDPDNLIVIAQVDGFTVELALGDANFGTRFRSFAAHYAEIRNRSPQARAFDLRLEDRITAKE